MSCEAINNDKVILFVNKIVTSIVQTSFEVFESFSYNTYHRNLDASCFFFIIFSIVLEYKSKK